MVASSLSRDTSFDSKYGRMLSGIWFDLDLVGGTFRKIAHTLPFVHAVDMERAILAGDYAGIFPHIWWVLGYGIGLLLLAVALFLRQMKRQ